MFKIIFPTGYQIIDPINDNIDINVAFENGKVYHATLFTLKNIQSLMLKDQTVHFWAEDIIVVTDLSKETIYRTVKEVINEGYIERAFGEIGNIEKVYGFGYLYEDLPDMSF
jgi:hypothetical protein